MEKKLNSVTRKCRTTPGALNQWFKWESTNYIRIPCPKQDIHNSNLV